MNSNELKVLELLEKDRHTPLSGSYLAKKLEISRTAIWKIINKLNAEGHKIESSKKGYQLGLDSNIISLQGISQHLARAIDAQNICVLKTTDSTNKIAKEKALQGGGHGIVITADEQTKGCGRNGHAFYSPKGTGVYISFILKNDLYKRINPASITMNAAVVACEAIEKISDKIPTIKWVNDILIDRKKVGGISTEAITNLENGEIEWIVLGIGINVSTSNFPPELETIATSISPNIPLGLARNKLLALLINSVLDENFGLAFDKTIVEYKKRLGFIGETIKVITPTISYEAEAIDVDEMGTLIVKNISNELINLRSGEITLKKL